MNLSFDIVIVEIIEHVADLFDSLYMPLGSALTHYVCYLRHRVLKHRIVLNVCCYIIRSQ